VILGAADQRPDWREVEVPWDPQPIAWRYVSHSARKAALRREAATPGLTHLVREVLTAPRPTESSLLKIQRYEPPLTPTRAHQAIEDAITELDRLAAHGVAVPEVSWHVYTGNDRITRVPARVAIIDGIEPEWSLEQGNSIPGLPTASNVIPTWRDSMRGYYSGTGYRIAEFDDITQYRYGPPRPYPQTPPNLCLVDVEPLQWVAAGTVGK